MSTDEIRFDDGAAYEHLMGRWTVKVGEPFLDWIGVAPGGRWLDVGCGNGAFTELLLQRAAPATVQAIDPSAAQLAYARQRLNAPAPVQWLQGDAMQLPVPSASQDAAVMALVLFFVPEPAAGLAEMLRAVRPGGTVAAYHWDILNGGFPLAAIGAELQKRGTPAKLPPSVSISTREASEALWRAAGLQQVRTTTFTVEREFPDFDDYWRSAASSNTVRALFEAMTADELQALRERVRERLGAGSGPLLVRARANAVCGVRGW